MTGQRPLFSVSFSPDGSALAVGGDDKTASIFEVASGQISSRLTLDDPVRGISFRGISFSRDGRYLTTAVSSNTAIAVNQNLLKPPELIDAACKRVNRNLSAAEWHQFVGPEMSCRATCTSLQNECDVKSVSRHN